MPSGMRKSACSWTSVQPRVRKRLDQLFRIGLAAVQPRTLLERHARIVGDRWRYDGPGQSIEVVLPQNGKVYVCGAGKAVVAFAIGLVHSLGDRLHSGLVVTKRGHTETCDPRVRILEAAHPVPDLTSQDAAIELERFLGEITADDVVFFLLTGGASALLAAPIEGISLADKQAVTRLLLASGADIHAMNAVRKHLSRLKGGNVARLVSPAHLVTLAVSDVIGDDPDSIGSGPTVPDPTTFSQAVTILRQRGLYEQLPSSVRIHLELGVEGQRPETPKRGDECFLNTRFSVLARLEHALDAIEQEASRGEVFVHRLADPLEGDVEACATRLLGALDHLAASPIRPALVLAGGEPTVVPSAAGKGGRMQHLALLLASALEGRTGLIGLAAGTDGTDGPTDAAGAFFSGDTTARARALGLDPERHRRAFNAYPFFAALGDLLMTGPTGTNVMDIVMIWMPE
jgi:glycerate 2-kinase